ncbi:MAG: hypothetical protein CMF61_00260 [Magnetococcales bacterium]|nr:hypothetical protein [Magnetococcales bacterium]
MKALPKYMILYCSDGTYTILENNQKKDYGFNYKHKKLDFETVQTQYAKLISSCEAQAQQV